MVIRRRRVEVELVVEQTRDLGGVAAMLTAAGMTTEGIRWPAGCYLMAYQGREPVGVVGIETKVDAALMRSLVAIEPMRRRGGRWSRLRAPPRMRAARDACTASQMARRATI